MQLENRETDKGNYLKTRKIFEEIKTNIPIKIKNQM